MTLFATIAVVLTLVTVAIPVVTLLRKGEDNGDDKSAPISATALAMVLPAAVLGIYLMVSNHDWNAAPITAEPQASGAAPDMQTALSNLEAKLRDNPDDIDGWLLLANSYIQTQQFDEARGAFSRVLEMHDDRRARLGLAEVTVLQDRNALTGPAGQVFEDILVDEPLNPKALFYAGMAAVAREDNDLVRRRWGRLLELSPPDNIRRILQQQLDLLEPANVADVPVAASAGPAISIDIDVAPTVREQINAGDSLFVLARVPNQPGPPIAALRLKVESFPLTANISDANVMLPGRSLNDADELEVVARISKSGDAISKPGDIFGDVIFKHLANETKAVEVILDRVISGS